MEEWDENAMQEKMTYMDGDWCPKNFLEMSVPKTKLMLFGPLPRSVPHLTIRGQPIGLVDSFKYVGMYFQSTHRYIFAEHCKQKAKEAIKALFMSIVTVESSTGDLPPKEMLRVFMARVDPHLIHGCEVAIDVDAPSFKVLENAQLLGLRRILGVSAHSVKAPLYTETGIIPLAYRRIILALRYLIYLLGLPPVRLAGAALRDSIALLRSEKPGWMSDIKLRLQQLPVPVSLQWSDIETVEGVGAVVKRVEESCVEWLRNEIDSNDRALLLRGRFRAGQDITLHDIVKVRPYLTDIAIPSHRRAVIRLVFSEHCLAIEQLRRKDRRRLVVPRDLRLCRFCRAAVEDEPHALLYCTACPQPLRDRRQALLRLVTNVDRKLDWTSTDLDGYDILRRLLRSRVLLPKFGELVYNVLKVFNEFEVYIPDGYYVPDTVMT
ncbi:hypothetical protein CVT26_013292 [Gymnopilus dilepis]|uniref:Uncharacterized protein n=1 Tax=Gymnopilus dilepis TaxID=231916 RepID=A0A409VUL8_9AGAR|nr:hypothetical protein CVT26_013292 [Gymnopilus dilepis]